MKKVKIILKQFKDIEYLRALLVSLFFLLIAMIINFYAGTYATENASFPVTDIILSNINVYDVDGIFNYVPVVFVVFLFFICLYKPKRLPFVIKSLALFVVIRSIFITLTHIGPFPTQSIIYSESLIGKFTFTGDLFFSGHVGVPFLLALIFWENKYFRYLFILYSIFMGIIVLMGHYHYSIDVLSAYFITYTIFHITLYLFKNDRKMFIES